MKLAHSTYGLPGVDLLTATKAVSEAGFQGIELMLGQGYAIPENVSASERTALRKSLNDLGLELVALMPMLKASVEESAHRQNLELLARQFDLWRDIYPDHPPLITLLMGGESWETERDRLAGNLLDMAAVAEKAGGIIAAKPHFAMMVKTPQQAEWVMRKVDHPRMRLNYDLSHFSLAGFDMESSIQPLLPWISYIHAKDSKFNDAGQFQFLLPGEGKTDYRTYFGTLARHNVQACVCAEVSAMVFKVPGYDWREAMRFCHRVLSDGFTNKNLESK